jgi:hypothetical protein
VAEFPLAADELVKIAKRAMNTPKKVVADLPAPEGLSLPSARVSAYRGWGLPFDLAWDVGLSPKWSALFEAGTVAAIVARNG